MNVSTFIARRIAFNKQKSFSRFIIRLATAATALSVAAMIITVCLVTGFQDAISNKVFSFWGHLRIQEYEPNKALVAEESPIMKDASVVHLLQQNPAIKHFQPFATKSAVIAQNKDIEGVLIKGVGNDYDFSNLQPYLKSGNWIHFTQDSTYSKDIVLSEPIAKELKVKSGDDLVVYFITGQSGHTISRKMHIAGIYKTGIEDYDRLFVLADLKLIQSINNWNNQQIGGYEVFLKDYHSMDKVSNVLYDELPNAWISRTIREVYPNIFDWLNIQDVNRNVIFIVMAIVAIINLITCLLILVLERTKMTGVLKSIGATNKLIQKIFLQYASIIAIRGILIGFLFGTIFCLLEQQFGFIRLDEGSYYIKYAPITMVWGQILLICVVTFVVCFVSLLLPTIIIRRIQPVRAISFS